MVIKLLLLPWGKSFLNGFSQHLKVPKFKVCNPQSVRASNFVFLFQISFEDGYTRVFPTVISTVDSDTGFPPTDTSLSQRNESVSLSIQKIVLTLCMTEINKQLLLMCRPPESLHNYGSYVTSIQRLSSWTGLSLLDPHCARTITFLTNSCITIHGGSNSIIEYLY